jgi:hypothetical protein
VMEDARSFASRADYLDFERKLRPPQWEEIEVEKAPTNVGLVERWYRHAATGSIWRFIKPDPPFRGRWERVRSDADGDRTRNDG